LKDASRFVRDIKAYRQADLDGKYFFDLELRRSAIRIINQLMPIEHVATAAAITTRRAAAARQRAPGQHADTPVDFEDRQPIDDNINVRAWSGAEHT